MDHTNIEKRIADLSFMDDIFFNTCFNENIPATTLLLRIIIGRELAISDVRAQEFVRNLYGRSLQLDAHALDADGNNYNIEVQRIMSGANPKRLRYHSSLLDANTIIPGTDFKDLPESYVIFITEGDYYELGFPLYHIERYVEETKQAFGDMQHLIYVNGSYDGTDEIGKLAHDLRETDPSKMYYKEFAESSTFYKINPKGVSIMKSTMQEYRDQVVYERAIETAKRALANGKLTHEEIAQIVGLTLNEIKTLAGEASA